jgi:DNA-binding GntR family transcriptional regulator
MTDISVVRKPSLLYIHRKIEIVWRRAPVTQSERARATLQRMIEEGALRPGSMISERDLMALTGLGRTPVREAVQWLERGYMVRVHPSKGIEIPADPVEDQLCRLEVRRAMEVLAVGLACERATRADLGRVGEMATRLEGEFSLGDYGETVRLTHGLITDCAHNPYLGTLMAPLQSLSRRFWLTHIRDEEVEVRLGKSLHRAILAAISDRDGEAARAASLALNDYLVAFAARIIDQRIGAADPARPRGAGV